MIRQNVLQTSAQGHNSRLLSIHVAPRPSLSKEILLDHHSAPGWVVQVGLTWIPKQMPTQAQLMLSPFDQVQHSALSPLIDDIRLGQNPQGTEAVGIKLLGHLEDLLGSDVDIAWNHGQNHRSG